MESIPINIADIIVLVILLLSGLLAFSRGFVHEVLSVAAWVGAAIATFYGLGYVAPFAKGFIASDLVAQIVSGVLIFIVVLILLSLISGTLSRRVRQSHLGTLDRSLGLVFGVLRGALLICLAWLVFTWLVPEEKRPVWIAQAASRPLIERGAIFLRDLVPEDIRKESETALDEAVDGAVDKATETTSEAVQRETERSLREAITPQPSEGRLSKGSGPEGTSGYKDDEREGLERLIEQNAQ